MFRSIELKEKSLQTQLVCVAGMWNLHISHKLEGSTVIKLVVRDLYEMRAIHCHSIRLSGKFVQLVSKCISETFGFCHSIVGAFLLRYTNFGLIGSFLSYEKKKRFENHVSSFFLNVEH